MNPQVNQAAVDGTVVAGTNVGAWLLGVEPVFQAIILVFTLGLLVGRAWLMYKDIQDRSKKRNRRASDRKEQ